MMSIHIRPPAVAGMFYPAEANILAEMVDNMLAQTHPATDIQPKALIAPHAGYIYSGPVAASAYALLQKRKKQITRMVLLGPVHRVPVRGLALPEADAFSTPLGEIPLDQEAMETANCLPQVVSSPAAHAPEHSLEVHLPFLQRILDDFTLVPLVVGDAAPGDVAEVLDVLWGGDETLIVISSDLSHYLPYEQARETDRRTADAILQGQWTIRHDQACGATPINGLLAGAGRWHLTPQLLDLRNSGDTAGDRQQVVGYGAFAFTEAA